MRALQLPAIAAVCPLTVVLATCATLASLSALSACQRVIQPVGQYQAEEQPSTPQHNPQAGSASTAHGQAGSGAGVSLAQPSRDAGDPMLGAASHGSSTAWPPLLKDGGLADAQVPPPNSSGGSVCQPTTSFAAKRRRLDMYLLMDANITLPITGLWEFATAGLRDFAVDWRSQEIGVGLRFFGAECSPEAYDTATVEVDLLSSNQSAITASTQARMNFTASPMEPALAGGIRHQRRRAMQHPDWKQVVVLLSDGFTQDFSCAYTEQDLENDASTGFIGPPSIETYVLGFGLPNTPTAAADIIARFSPLDSIANAGGTYSAVTVPVSADPQAMNEALQTVRRNAEPCEYQIPGNIDPNQLSFVLSLAGELPRVDADTSCGRLPGWHFDNPTQPTWVVLCPVSCQAMQKDDSQLAVLRYGCPPKRR
jgi:hypothetical protein